MGEKKQKLVFLAKHGPEHAEKATLPFATALGAMASDLDAVIALQSDAVLLARKGVADHVFAAGMSPLKEMMDLYLSEGGTLIVCTACMTARKIAEGDIIDGATIGSVAVLASEFSEADNIICY